MLSLTTEVGVESCRLRTSFRPGTNKVASPREKEKKRKKGKDGHANGKRTVKSEKTVSQTSKEETSLFYYHARKVLHSYSPRIHPTPLAPLLRTVLPSPSRVLALSLSLSSTKNDSKLVAAPVLLFVFFFLVMCATISNPQYCSFVFATV